MLGGFLFVNYFQFQSQTIKTYYVIEHILNILRKFVKKIHIYGNY